MQTNYQSSQPTRKLGLPSSPACTRPRRDAPFIEAHSRAQSQPIVFAPVRPLRPHRHKTSKLVLTPTIAAHLPKLPLSPEPRSVGSTFVAHSRPLATRQSSTSVTSESSTSSVSFRLKGALSRRSSFTSLEDELEESKKSNDTFQIKLPLFSRQRRVLDVQHNNGYSLVSGSDDSIWGRVSTATSTSEGNVSKTCASMISASEEEETSPGCDSHLVRVIKAYHLAKATHPSDLPSWLFDEHEWKPSPSSHFAESPRGTVSDVLPLGISSLHISSEQFPRALHRLPSLDKMGPSKAKTFREAKRVGLGVGYVPSKSESLSHSPSRTHFRAVPRRVVDHGDRPTKQPVQQLRPGAF